ncbi:Rho GTPase activation protein [Blastocladiella britannica]|nr:Rho GTPase activation protein [Blastocladiella britannica]
MADKPPGTVPLVVERCIAAVEAIGMDMEGVYRKSAPHMLLKQAVADFDRGLVPNLADEDIYGDVTVATSLLKQYLRDLPNPLITFGVYPLVKEAMRATEEQGGKVAAMRRALAQLPPAHATTLTYLFAHLRRVVDRASENRMTSHNVGVVFGPSLMSGQSGADAIFDMASIDVVEFLVTNQVAVFDGLFPTPAPPPPAAAVSGDASTEPSADVPLSRSVGSQPLGGGSGRIGSPGPLPRLNLPSLGTADGLMDFSLLYLTDNVSLRGTPASEIRRPSLAAGDTSRQPYAPSS